MVAGTLIGDQPFFRGVRDRDRAGRMCEPTASHHVDPGHHKKESTAPGQGMTWPRSSAAPSAAFSRQLGRLETRAPLIHTVDVDIIVIRSWDSSDVDLERVDNFRPLAEPDSPRSAERGETRIGLLGCGRRGHRRLVGDRGADPPRRLRGRLDRRGAAGQGALAGHAAEAVPELYRSPAIGLFHLSYLLGTALGPAIVALILAA
jgi:hypothetical protein